MADHRVAPQSAESAGKPDFSGYWRQIKNENMDAFLQVPSSELHRVFTAADRVCSATLVALLGKPRISIVP